MPKVKITKSKVLDDLDLSYGLDIVVSAGDIKTAYLAGLDAIDAECPLVNTRMTPHATDKPSDLNVVLEPRIEGAWLRLHKLGDDETMA